MITFQIFMKAYSIILTVAMVTFFEISYRKDNLKYALTGIELLILNILVTYIPYVYYNKNEIIRKLIMLVPLPRNRQSAFGFSSAPPRKILCHVLSNHPF